jgi:predicted amidohydrolase YtcJ
MSRKAVGQEILRADTVVINAKVYTDGSSSDVREAFAIQDGRFLAVDSTAAVREFVGDATQVIDAQGAVVFPGLIDAHVHPSMGGQKVLYMCNFAFDATPAGVSQYD